VDICLLCVFSVLRPWICFFPCGHLLRRVVRRLATDSGYCGPSPCGVVFKLSLDIMAFAHCFFFAVVQDEDEPGNANMTVILDEPGNFEHRLR